MTDDPQRLLWLAVREGLYAIIRAIERVYQLERKH